MGWVGCLRVKVGLGGCTYANAHNPHHQTINLTPLKYLYKLTYIIYHNITQIQEDFESQANAAFATAEATFDGSELPAPSESYRIQPHQKEAPATLSVHSSKRNQRALKELRKGHDKWIKKKVAAPGT